MKEIYFDNASTTKPDEKILIATLNNYNYANPLSLHKKGVNALEQLNNTRKTIAKYLGVTKDEIYFTGSATESNNIAILGLKNKTVIASKNQHPSVTEPLKNLTTDICYLQTKDGILNLEQLKSNIDSKTNLVCLTHINNETGIINDIEFIGKMIKSINPKTVFHVDGVQGFGKINLNLKNSFVDSYSASMHKIHGLKGLGILYLKKGLSINPIIFGGTQENKIRPATHNTFSIFSSSAIIEDAYINIDTNYSYVLNLKNYFYNNLINLSDIIINGDLDNTSPYILNVSFLGLKGEIILNMLSENNIYVSNGSACTSKNKSSNLVNHLYDENIISSAVRFSFSKYNTQQEVDTCLEILEKNLKKIVKR